MSCIVLVIAAHPDDEVLGAGGALARHSANGDEVHVTFLADGVGARRSASQGEFVARKASAMAAAEILGIRKPCFLDLPDNRLDAIPLLDVIQKVERSVEEVHPKIVYTHHGGDLNVDHRIAHQATLTACRPTPESSIDAIYAFETPSSTEWSSEDMGSNFRPDRFVQIDLDLKLHALACYSQELIDYPHPRSLEAIAALARWRGACVGVPTAEAFIVVREIVR